MSVSVYSLELTLVLFVHFYRYCDPDWWIDAVQEFQRNNDLAFCAREEPPEPSLPTDPTQDRDDEPQQVALTSSKDVSVSMTPTKCSVEFDNVYDPTTLTSFDRMRQPATITVW